MDSFGRDCVKVIGFSLMIICIGRLIFGIIGVAGLIRNDIRSKKQSANVVMLDGSSVSNVRGLLTLLPLKIHQGIHRTSEIPSSELRSSKGHGMRSRHFFIKTHHWTYHATERFTYKLSPRSQMFIITIIILINQQPEKDRLVGNSKPEIVSVYKKHLGI